MILATLLTLAACTVTDGDTIRCGDERIRLLDIDAPELSQPKCPSERSRALAARDRLRELLVPGFVVHRGSLDRYGRTLARITVDGRDVGRQLVSEGHAREWRGRRLPWC